MAELQEMGLLLLMVGLWIAAPIACGVMATVCWREDEQLSAVGFCLIGLAPSIAVAMAFGKNIMGV